MFEHPRACSSWVPWRPRRLVFPRSSIIVVQSSGQASGSPIELWRLPRAFEVTAEAIVHCGEASWCRWEPPIKLWRLPQPSLYGFGDRPQGSLSGIMASCIVRGCEEITVALVASWGALCLHTAPNGDLHPQGCELRDRSSSPRASVISYPSPLLMHFTL